jgi:hypothetical protein
MHAEGEMITERSHSYVPRLRRRSLLHRGWHSMASQHSWCRWLGRTGLVGDRNHSVQSR